ncbi:MAG: hypothetical protein JXR12_15275 [Neptunomonas phycophila]|uniref:hypothetical protein n=1 Tax=Neptunomonas phycophila TaxID=1572645 RepID=UPI003B8BE104
MNSVTNYLTTLKGCPADSLLGTIQYLKHMSVDQQAINERIIQAIGIDVSGMTMPVEQRRYLFFYIIQTGWHAANRGEDISEELILNKAIEANNAFFAQSFVRSSIMAETTERRQKMSKGELAYELYCDNVDKLNRNEMIALISKEIETSIPGATTYYYGAKKKFGEK